MQPQAWHCLRDTRLVDRLTPPPDETTLPHTEAPLPRATSPAEYTSPMTVMLLADGQGRLRVDRVLEGGHRLRRCYLHFARERGTGLRSGSNRSNSTRMVAAVSSSNSFGTRRHPPCTTVLVEDPTGVGSAPALAEQRGMPCSRPLQPRSTRTRSDLSTHPDWRREAFLASSDTARSTIMIYSSNIAITWSRHPRSTMQSANDRQHHGLRHSSALRSLDVGDQIDGGRIGHEGQAQLSPDRRTPPCET